MKQKEEKIKFRNQIISQKTEIRQSDASEQSLANLIE